MYTESLTAQHSGISNDVHLFSEVGLSLVHHYRVLVQIGPSTCCVSWEVFGAAALSPTGEHGPVSGRAIRRCLLAGAIDGRSDGCFVSSTQTPPPASMGHESACTDRALTYRAGPADGGGSSGV